MWNNILRASDDLWTSAVYFHFPLVLEYLFSDRNLGAITVTKEKEWWREGEGGRGKGNFRKKYMPVPKIIAITGYVGSANDAPNAATKQDPKRNSNIQDTNTLPLPPFPFPTNA